MGRFGSLLTSEPYIDHEDSKNTKTHEEETFCTKSYSSRVLRALRDFVVTADPLAVCLGLPSPLQHAAYSSRAWQSSADRRRPELASARRRSRRPRSEH